MARESSSLKSPDFEIHRLHTPIIVPKILFLAIYPFAVMINTILFCSLYFRNLYNSLPGYSQLCTSKFHLPKNHFESPCHKILCNGFAWSSTGWVLKWALITWQVFVPVPVCHQYSAALHSLSSHSSAPHSNPK